MLPHQERVIEEEKDLREKFNKLGAFLYGYKYEQLLDHDKDLLRWQYRHMGAYLDVLAARIKRF